MAPRNHHGFTLLELLVVTAVIGILAAIAIPFYGRYKASGIDAQMVSALRNARTATEAFYNQNGDSYSGLTTTALEDNGFRRTNGVTMKIVEVQPSSYKIRACEDGGSSAAFLVDSNGTGSPVPDPLGVCS